jgi:hypothetical protein
MAAYYRFRWDNEAPLKDLHFADVGNLPDLKLSWLLGAKFRTAVPTPIRCALDTKGGTDIPDVFFFSNIPLYSDRLLSALRSAGVDNLDVYDVELLDPRSGEVRKDYKATNIVGKIECVNLKKSKYDDSSEFPMIEFEEIVLNEKKIGAAKMFRLAENPLFIIVSQDVKDQLDESEWAGIRVVGLDEFDAY